MKKTLALLLSFAMMVSMTACAAGMNKPTTASEEAPTETVSETEMAAETEPTPTEAAVPECRQLYNAENQVIALDYTGLDMNGLAEANKRYGSEGYGDANVDGGCSITFANYHNGRTGAIRNMDLHLSDYCSYELNIQPGDNVKYATWALAYTGVDSKSYKEVLETGLSPARYATLPFSTTDAMSFGYNEAGEEGALYCALLMRSDEQDADGNYIWTCSGTNPGAPLRCSTQSAATMIATQCLSVEDALKYVGAVDEDYNRIYPDVEPTLDIYTMNVETGTASNHWFEVVAMIDSTGHHGVLEFIDNHPIWHNNIEYSFNYFLQEDYLHNPDGSYRETGGAGIGRYEAVVPYLKYVRTVSDHLDLMDGIRYSYMTYYSEPDGYTGHDGAGYPVDWRSEFTHLDVWKSYHDFKYVHGLNTNYADVKYPLWANYQNTETGEIVRIDSYEQWKQEKNHLKSLYDMNYVLDDANYEEIMNYVRWHGLFFGSLTKEQVKTTGAAWETYFRVICDPMALRVTRWFNEDVNTADSICFRDMVK